MRSTNDPLRTLKVASPCPASWDEMTGNDRVRFCGQCQLNVYNISGMRRVEAERLIASTEGRLCVRYYRRRDGTILTKDCPVGFARFRRRVAKVASAVVGMLAGVLGGTAATAAFESHVDSAPAAMGKVHVPEVVGIMAPVEPAVPSPAIVIEGGAIDRNSVVDGRFEARPQAKPNR
jgi:hypothetical protein